MGLTGCTSLGDAPARDAASASDASGLPENLDPNPPASIPAFDTTSVAGALVDGFPADTVPVPPDAQILASSAADVEGSTLRQVTLNLSSTASVQEILDFYAAAMTGASFAALPGGAPGGLSGQAAFNRVPSEGVTETLFVGILDTTEARLVTISGQVVPPA